VLLRVKAFAPKRDDEEPKDEEGKEKTGADGKTPKRHPRGGVQPKRGAQGGVASKGKQSQNHGQGHNGGYYIVLTELSKK
jgi:hypothetical protein